MKWVLLTLIFHGGDMTLLRVQAGGPYTHARCLELAHNVNTNMKSESLPTAATCQELRTIEELVEHIRKKRRNGESVTGNWYGDAPDVNEADKQ